MNTRKSLTAAELITELAKLPPDTIVTTHESDSEWMRTTVWSISAVSETGALAHGNIVDSFDDWPLDDEDDL